MPIVLSIYLYCSGNKGISAKDVKMTFIVQAKNHSTDGEVSVDMMKVQQLELCLTKLSSLC